MYERARTMPSKRRAVVVLLLGVVIAVLPWVSVRLYVLRAGARVAINCLWWRRRCCCLLTCSSCDSGQAVSM